jgi:hypothetical protein
LENESESENNRKIIIRTYVGAWTEEPGGAGRDKESVEWPWHSKTNISKANKIK